MADAPDLEQATPAPARPVRPSASGSAPSATGPGSADDPQRRPTGPPRPGRRFLPSPAAVGVGVLIALALTAFGVRYLIHARHFESTDDAFIEGRISASRRARPAVAAEQLLVEIDSRDYASRVDQARAQVGAAEAEAQRAAEDTARTRLLFERQ